MRYKIAWHFEPEKVEEEVTLLLKKGWQLHGGLIACVHCDLQYYAQALVKSSDEQPRPTKPFFN